jgi:hypothetical protein
MGKTILIAALLLATAPACAETVTHCHTHTTGDGDSDRDCETGEKPPTEEDVAMAHHMANFWANRQEWRKTYCGNAFDEYGDMTGPLPKAVPVGMQKYVFDQCRKPW